MKTISLACRGGGVKSAGSVGVLKAIDEMGFTISRISGTSIASIIAALYSTGTSPDDILLLLKEHVIIYSNASRIYHLQYILEKIRGFFTHSETSRTPGANGNFKIIETSVNKETGSKTFEDCNIPLTITASHGNFIFRKPVVFSEEDFPNLTLGKACRASCSFPFLYEKYHLDYKGTHYALLDGGLTLNPFITKEDNEVAILSTYYKRPDLKQNTLSLYAPAWQQAEALSDLVIKPVLPFGTLGTPDDLQKAFDIAYDYTLKMHKEIESLVLGHN